VRACVMCVCDVCVCVCVCVCAGEEPGAKQGKLMCLLEKMEVLGMLHSGVSIAAAIMV
jgi:hypothetical protein